MIQFTGRVEIPKELLAASKAKSLLSKRELYAVAREVEAKAIAGAGKVLDQHLSSVQAAVGLRPETLERKRRDGLPDSPLVGRRGRILKAVRQPKSNFRGRVVYADRTGTIWMRWFLNPKRFAIPGKDYPFTAVLQRGRLLGIQFEKTGKVMKAGAMNWHKKHGTAGWIGETDHATLRTEGWPIMEAKEADRAVVTPVLKEAYYAALIKRLGAGRS